jgi:hypothetical protein
MATKTGTIELKKGDACPNCGGTIAPDPRHDADRLIERYKGADHNDVNVARFTERTRQKVDTAGVMHACQSCGYQSRFQNGGQGQAGTGNDWNQAR